MKRMRCPPCFTDWDDALIYTADGGDNISHSIRTPRRPPDLTYGDTSCWQRRTTMTVSPPPMVCDLGVRLSHVAARGQVTGLAARRTDTGQ